MYRVLYSRWQMLACRGLSDALLLARCKELGHYNDLRASTGRTPTWRGGWKYMPAFDSTTALSGLWRGRATCGWALRLAGAGHHHGIV
jgi:hypothetical protein